jgi:molybdopterin converting factor small subunit
LPEVFNLKEAEIMNSKVRIPVKLPSLLAHCAGGARDVMVYAGTLGECLDQLAQEYPLLKIHLFEEDGRQRPHVLFFYNEENTRWFDHLDIPLKEGDRLTVLQAVSGG